MPEENMMHAIFHADSNTPIRIEGDMINLTDLHRASGSNPSQAPYEWLRQVGTRELILYLAQELFPAETTATGITRTVRGESGGTLGGGATWVHWHLGLAYAQYLSPALRIWCNNLVRAYFEKKRTSRLVEDLFPHHVEFVSGYERHLRRLVEHKTLTSGLASNLLSEVYEDLLGVRLPRVGVQSESRTALAGEKLGKVEEAPSRPVPVVVKEGDQVLHPEKGQEALVANTIDGRVWWTANELAERLDFASPGQAGLLTCYLKRSFDRDGLGRKVSDLLRSLKLHPATSKKYTPEAGVDYTPWSLIAPEGMTVRAMAQGDRIAVHPGQVFFNDLAWHKVHTHLQKEVAVRGAVLEVRRTKEEVLGASISLPLQEHALS